MACAAVQALHPDSWKEARLQELDISTLEYGSRVKQDLLAAITQAPGAPAHHLQLGLARAIAAKSVDDAQCRYLAACLAFAAFADAVEARPEEVDCERGDAYENLMIAIGPDEALLPRQHEPAPAPPAAAAAAAAAGAQHQADQPELFQPAAAAAVAAAAAAAAALAPAAATALPAAPVALPAPARRRPAKPGKPGTLPRQNLALVPAGTVEALAAPILRYYSGLEKRGVLQTLISSLRTRLGIEAFKADVESTIRKDCSDDRLFIAKGEIVLCSKHRVVGGAGDGSSGSSNSIGEYYGDCQLDGRLCTVGGQPTKVQLSEDGQEVTLSATAWLPTSLPSAKMHLEMRLHIVLAAGLLVLYGKHMERTVKFIPGCSQLLTEVQQQAAASASHAYSDRDQPGAPALPMLHL